MKRKGFLIDIVIGTEYERMSVFNPVNGQIVFEGNTSDAMAFLAEVISNFKNTPENESI